MLVAEVAASASVPVVVVPDSPTAVEKFAAGELVGELGKCLGGAPSVVSESDVREGRAPARPCLYVGATKAAKAARGDKPWETDEVFLKSVEDGVVMDGDPARAPIYAVDLYLEKYCGVRWWTSVAATHPKLADAPLVGIDLRYAPPLKYRETYYLDGFDPLFKVRSKGNFTSQTCAHMAVFGKMKFIPPEMGGNHRLYFFEGRKSSYHSFFQILPPKTYFAAHPEWYTLRDGKRVPEQLCLANEEMKSEYIRETLKRLREDPSADFISVSQNDAKTGMCECERCKAMAAEDGDAPSGPYLRFANEVAEAVEKEFPKVRIDTFAYKFTRKAPTKTRPRHNVIVRLCASGCDFSRALDDPASAVNARFAKDLAAWKSVAGDNLFVWEYLANFSNYMLPLPDFSRFGRNVRFFAANGAVGVFEQGDALCAAGYFAPLIHYVVSHLLWDPSLDEGALIDEFLAGYYGKAAPPHIKRLFSIIGKSASKPLKGIRCHYDTMWFLTPWAKLAAADAMDKAVAAAGKEDEVFASRVRRERLSVDHYILLEYDKLKALAEKNGTAWTRPATRAEAVENWIRDVKACGVKARAETVSDKEIHRYFEKLRRGGGKPPDAARKQNKKENA